MRYAVACSRRTVIRGAGLLQRIQIPAQFLFRNRPDDPGFHRAITVDEHERRESVDSELLHEGPGVIVGIGVDALEDDSPFVLLLKPVDHRLHRGARGSPVGEELVHHLRSRWRRGWRGYRHRAALGLPRPRDHASVEVIYLLEALLDKVLDRRCRT